MRTLNGVCQQHQQWKPHCGLIFRVQRINDGCPCARRLCSSAEQALARCEQSEHGAPALSAETITEAELGRVIAMATLMSELAEH